ncbi:MAG: NAD-dependent epimerase/dehydratase family protein, partial [Planctomycetota bacterium]
SRSRCLVTGGAGFIGGHIVAALLDLGATVAVIDDLSNSTLEHLGPLIEQDPERLRLVRASILDPRAVEIAMRGAEVVFHAAALCSVPRSIEDPRRTWEVNAGGTMAVLEAARRVGVRRFVYSASSSAYGDVPGLPKRESSPVSPVSPYAASKLAGEHAVAAFAHSFGLTAVSLRYFNIIGPRQAADSPYAGVIPAFAKRIVAGEAPVIFGDGSQTRDFTPVQNAVYANLLAATVADPAPGLVCNIGAGERTTVSALASRVCAAFGKPELEPEHHPARTGDVRHSQADITLAREALGYEPFVELGESIENTVAWYRYALGAVSH